MPLFSGEFQQVIDTVNVFRLNWKLIKILRWLLISSWKKILLLYIGCVFLLIWHTGMHILGDRNCFTWHISFAECSFLLGEGGVGICIKSDKFYVTATHNFLFQNLKIFLNSHKHINICCHRSGNLRLYISWSNYYANERVMT